MIRQKRYTHSRCGVAAILTATLALAGSEAFALPCPDNLDPEVAAAEEVVTPTPDEAAYDEVQSLATGAADDRLYDAVLRCYKSNLAVATDPATLPADARRARSIIASITPMLQDGAAYFSGKGDSDRAVAMACAFVDVCESPDYKEYNIKYNKTLYPKMAYFAAAGAYNTGDYAGAIPYLKAYIGTGDQSHRHDVFKFLGQAAINSGRYNLATMAALDGSVSYPDDINLINIGINAAMETGDADALQTLLTRAKAIQPDDERYDKIQGKLYEDAQDFQRAARHYATLLEKKPNSLEYAKHLALNRFNLGVWYYNKAYTSEDEKSAKRAARQATEYFTAAIGSLNELLDNDPYDVMTLRAIGTAYRCIDDKEHFNAINDRLATLGVGAVSDRDIPRLMSTDDSLAQRRKATAMAEKESLGGESYGEYERKFVENDLSGWLAKDSYETMDEYNARVNPSTRAAKVEEARRRALDAYVSTHTGTLYPSEFVLHPYDADNRTFMISNDELGQIVINVPRENNEAAVFEALWSDAKLRNPQYYVYDDKLMLRSLDIAIPVGRTYHYEVTNAPAYNNTEIDVKWDELVADNTPKTPGRPTVTTNKVTIGGSGAKSDIDLNIPVNATDNDRTFAVIIANENYSMVSDVQYAINDGSAFAQYCNLTLGLPTNNIRTYTDATYGVFLRALSDISDIAKAYDGDINVIFYYAGHGIPEESTKDAYLLPVDGDGRHTAGCYPLSTLYADLGKTGANSVSVFIDACFSGSDRSGDVLDKTRGIALVPKKTDPRGNMFIFTAASDDQTALPYADKQHGLFTYFLLKKLQETGGNVTMGELVDAVGTDVRRQSLLVNKKQQTPVYSVSGNMSDTWHSHKLIKK